MKNRLLFLAVVLSATVGLVGSFHIAFGGEVFGGEQDDLVFGDVGRSSTSRPRLILNTDFRIATSTSAAETNLTRFFLDTASSTLSGFEIRKVGAQTANFSEWQDESGNPLVYIDPSGNIFTSGTISSEGVSSTGHFYPAANNTYDLGRYGLAWRDIYVSGTALLGGAVSLGASAGNSIVANGRFDSQLSPGSGNLYDLGVSGIAWRDVFASGTINTNAFRLYSASATLFYTDLQSSNNYRGPALIQYLSNQVPTQALEAALTVHASSSAVNGSQLHQPRALDFEQIWSGTSGPGTVSVDGINGFATLQTGAGGGSAVTNLRGGAFGASFQASGTVRNAIGVQGSISMGSGAGGSYISTSTGVFGFYAGNITGVTIEKSFGLQGVSRGGPNGQVLKAMGVYGRATFGSSTFAGYFSQSPVWIDPDDEANVSNHGASNTPGALFVGGVGEFDADLYIDGSLRASTTFLSTGAATLYSTLTAGGNILSGTNNDVDIGAFGSAFRAFYASGAIRFGGTAATTSLNFSSAPAGVAGRGTCIALTATDGSQWYMSVVGGVATTSPNNCL